MRIKTLVMGVLVLLSLLIVGGCGNNTTGNSVVDTNEYVSIPLSDLSGEAKFYTFEDGGVRINYFAVLGSDGEPRTAFDACDVCGGSKGYEQIGSDIRCRNCGRVFSIDGLGTKNKGYGCWPSYLPHEVDGNNLLIKKSDIVKEKAKF